MIEEKCYFHSERHAEKICKFCKRSVCEICLAKGDECWACRFINYSKSEERLKIDTIRQQRISFSNKGLIYSIPKIWIGNWKEDDFKLFSLMGTQFLSFPLIEEEVDIFYVDADKKYVSTIWSKGMEENNAVEKPCLLYSEWNVRDFNTAWEKIKNFILKVLLPLSLFGVLANRILHWFFRNNPLAGWLNIIFIITFFILLFFLINWYRKNIHPCFWKGDLSEFNGEVEENLLGDNGCLEWSVRKKDGTLIGQGWKMFLRVKTQNMERKRVLVEGIGMRPLFTKNEQGWSFEIVTGERNGSLIIKPGKRYKFKGRDLFNVLVCNLSLIGKHKNESKIEALET